MKTSTLDCLAGSALLALAGASLAFAESATSSSPPPASTRPLVATETSRPAADAVPRGDRRFFRQAARLGEQEVVVSRIASERAIHPQVRAFAAEMVREHNTVNEELAALARRKGALLEPRDRVEVREEERKWNAKKGDNFDEDYLDAVIDAHQDTIDVLENGAESKDPEIAAYANKVLPKVKAHLAHAESLESTVD
jgi:putative membrane protein